MHQRIRRRHQRGSIILKDQKQKVKILLKNDEIIETKLTQNGINALLAAVDSSRQFDRMNIIVELFDRDVNAAEIAEVIILDK